MIDVFAILSSFWPREAVPVRNSEIRPRNVQRPRARGRSARPQARQPAGRAGVRVVLVDVDLARAGRPEAGRPAGTWRWTAPEQAVLDASEIDARSDVYALGTRGCFAFTGQPLFSAGPEAIREQLAEEREQQRDRASVEHGVRSSSRSTMDTRAASRGVPHRPGRHGWRHVVESWRRLPAAASWRETMRLEVPQPISAA